MVTVPQLFNEEWGNIAIFGERGTDRVPSLFNGELWIDKGPVDHLKEVA